MVGEPGDTCLSSVLGLLGGRLASREEQIELAASLVKDRPRLGDVRRVTGAG